MILTKLTSERIHQHVHINTRGYNTLDHVYRITPGSHRAHLRPQFSLSDHVSLPLLPTNFQLIKRVKVRTVPCCFQAEVANMLRTCFFFFTQRGA